VLTVNKEHPAQQARQTAPTSIPGYSPSEKVALCRP
jgi:hypothetical protein